MAQERERLSEAELERIYTRRIRPDFMDEVARSTTPTAVLVGGQPGAGKSYAMAQLRANLLPSVGPAVALSGDDLREYHPYWRSHAGTDPQAAALTQIDAGQWYARLTNDAITKRVNIVFETSMRQPEATLALASRLRGEGYQVAAVVVAADRQQSRIATLTRYDAARTVGDVPRFVPAAYHDGAYDRLRETVARLETQRAVDRLQLVTRDGRSLYANQLDADRWHRQPNGPAALDDYRERKLTVRELADNALRWQTLVQRLAGNAAVPRDVAAQTVMWRNEATARAEQDPEARQLLTWGREAESFRTMNRYQFLREFPHHAQAVHRLDEAIDYAEKEYPHSIDRERFVEQARARIAERIAEGRLPTKEHDQDRDHGGRTR